MLVSGAMSGRRLDYALRRWRPELSVRAARRMIEDGLVSVNGEVGKPCRKLAQGDEVVLAQPGAATPTGGARLLEFWEDYCFFYKPAGMHTVALAGRENASLERAAPLLLDADGIQPEVRLLQRLDCGTCGIVAGTLSVETAMRYRLAEKMGRCVKTYAAVLCGRLARGVWAKNRLDCAGGKKARIRQLAAESPLEWTYFEPLAYAQNLTLARCVIRMGKRHQIRAHAAALGLPLLGDSLYGAANGGNFFLEHYQFSMPGYELRQHDPACGLEKMFPDADKLLEEAACTS